MLKRYSGSEHVNVGSGEDLSILELTQLVCRIVGYEGRIMHDLSKPDGTPRKLLDMSKLFSMGWKPRVPLREGIRGAYDWYLQHGSR